MTESLPHPPPVVQQRMVEFVVQCHEALLEGHRVLGGFMDIFGLCPAAEPLVQLLFTCGSLNSVKAAFSVHLLESTVAMTMVHLQSQLLFSGQHPLICSLL